MITSVQNSIIKDIKKLHKKKYREQMNQFLVEGHHLVNEAHLSDFIIDKVILREDVALPEWIAKKDVIYVTNEVFQTITQTETPQGIAAVVNKHTFSNEASGHVLLLDAIQDPGNLGTMIRTAEAAGFTKVILGKGTVDPYNDKVIRATQGSIFYLPIIQADLAEVICELKSNHYEIWAATLDDSQVYHEIEVTSDVGLIIGNEGAGISQEVVNQANRNVKIPIYGRSESLNAGVASGVLMYYLQTSFAR